MPYDFLSCRDAPLKAAYSLTPISRMVLCPTTLPPNRNHIVGNRAADYVGVYHTSINAIARVTSVTILHELMHIIYTDSSEFNILCPSLFYDIDKTNIYCSFSGFRI